jgi:hypothetical protein
LTCGMPSGVDDEIRRISYTQASENRHAS